MARAGFAHGDLSAYNLLVHDGRLVVIDLPQIVDVVANPQGREFLARDARNVATWFAAHGVAEADGEALRADLARRRRHPLNRRPHGRVLRCTDDTGHRPWAKLYASSILRSTYCRMPPWR